MLPNWLKNHNWPNWPLGPTIRSHPLDRSCEKRRAIHPIQRHDTNKETLGDKSYDVERREMCKPCLSKKNIHIVTSLKCRDVWIPNLPFKRGNATSQNDMNVGMSTKSLWHCSICSIATSYVILFSSFDPPFLCFEGHAYSWTHSTLQSKRGMAKFPFLVGMTMQMHRLKCVRGLTHQMNQ